MDLAEIIAMIKQSAEYEKMGMIASHVGIVRRTSLSGESVSSIEVSFDQDQVSMIREEIKARQGIYEVLIQTFEGRLDVGDEIMIVAVGGDIRTNVFPALTDAVNMLKSRASRKREIF